MNRGIDITKPTKKQILTPIIVFGILLVLGGILLWIAKTISTNEEPQTIFIAPSTQTIVVTKPGEYTIDVAIETTYKGKSYSLPEDFTGIEGVLTLNGEQVVLNEVLSSVYGKEGQKGKTLFTFAAEKTGDYLLKTDINHVTESEAVLVSRRTDNKDGIMTILVTGACFLILMGLCQLVAYSLFNLIKWGILFFNRKVI